MSPSLPIVRGTVSFLALAALARGGRMHGFQGLRWIQQSSDGDLLIEEGALYPTLHRMEKQGWIEADWAVSEKGRRAKYYSLTKAGERALSQETTAWSKYVDAVAKVTGEGTS